MAVDDAAASRHLAVHTAAPSGTLEKRVPVRMTGPSSGNLPAGVGDGECSGQFWNLESPRCKDNPLECSYHEGVRTSTLQPNVVRIIDALRVRVAMRLLIILLIAAAAAGCAVNPYAEHFSRIRLAHTPVLEPFTGEPRVIQGANEEQDRLHMLEAGYVPLGYSSFNGHGLDERAAIAQAKAVGASVVLVYTQAPQFAGPGSSYAATYWRMGRPASFGVFVRVLEPDEQTTPGRVGGLLVIAVRRDSPADRAGLLAGDVIDRIGKVTLHSNSDMQGAMIRYAGRTAEVDIVRGGKALAKLVTFGALE